MSEKLNALKTIFSEATENAPASVKPALDNFAQKMVSMVAYDDNLASMPNSFGTFVNGMKKALVVPFAAKAFQKAANKTEEGKAFAEGLENKVKAWAQKYQQ